MFSRKQRTLCELKCTELLLGLQTSSTLEGCQKINDRLLYGRRVVNRLLPSPAVCFLITAASQPQAASLLVCHLGMLHLQVTSDCLLEAGQDNNGAASIHHLLNSSCCYFSCRFFCSTATATILMPLYIRHQMTITVLITRSL